MSINVLIGGAHRGGKAIVNQLQDETVRLYDPHWILADPKPDRAAQMASSADKPFSDAPAPTGTNAGTKRACLQPRSRLPWFSPWIRSRIPCKHWKPGCPSQRVSFQITGRGPGGVAGTRLAIQGTICPGDHDTDRAALLFLHTMAGMSQAASSRHLTGPDPPQRGSPQAAAPGGESSDSPASGRERAGA